MRSGSGGEMTDVGEEGVEAVDEDDDDEPVRVIVVAVSGVTAAVDEVRCGEEEWRARLPLDERLTVRPLVDLDAVEGGEARTSVRVVRSMCVVC